MATLDFNYIEAGRNFGDLPWRDPANPEFAYHVRENDRDVISDPEGYEAVRINLRTGVAVRLQFWDRDDDFGDYGAIFTDPQDIGTQTNLCGSLTGTKLYQFAQSGDEPSENCDNRIIEFNKSDMSISKSFATSNNVAQRDIGSSVCNANGTIVARAGSLILGVADAFEGSLIELYRPSDDAYGYVNLKDDLWIDEWVGLNHTQTTPIAFDNAGFLWLITQPYGQHPTRGPYQADKSVLRKFSVTSPGGGVLGLTLVDSYTIEDEFHAFGSGMGAASSFGEAYGWNRLVFDHAELKFYMWSAWDDDLGTAREGWFFEFDPASETFTRGPLDWTQPINMLVKHDSRGFHCDDKYATAGFLGTGFSSFTLNIFDVPSGTEDNYVYSDFPNDIFTEGSDSTMTYWHVSDGASSYVYVFDVRTEFDPDEFFRYDDGLFSILIEESGCPSSGFDLAYPPCVTTFTQCVKITRRDGVSFRFTSLDRDIEFRGETYVTCGGLDPSATQTLAQVGEVSSSELGGLITTTGVEEEELYGGLFDDAFVEIWLVDYEGSEPPRRLAAGWAGKITHSTRGYKMEVLGPGARLEQRPIVQTYTPQCRWVFGDERCGVDIEALAISGTVTSGLNRGVFTASLGDPASSGTGAPESSGALPGQFANGKVIWLTGVNAGQTTEVKEVDFDTGVVTLWALTCRIPEAGDTFSLYPGCDQTFDTCKDVYDNGVRNGGFPHVPGRDAITRSPDAKVAT